MDEDFNEAMYGGILSYVEIELIDTDLFVTNHDGSVSAKMELSDMAEAEVVNSLLRSNDFWASFLGSLSAALGKHR